MAIYCSLRNAGSIEATLRESNSQSNQPSYVDSAAPEVIANQGGYSPLCDIWSLGVILYVLYVQLCVEVTAQGCLMLLMAARLP